MEAEILLELRKLRDLLDLQIRMQLKEPLDFDKLRKRILDRRI